MLKRLFLDHPESVDERYGEHLVTASGFGVTLIGAGLACLVHALVPGLFASTGSRAIEQLHERMVTGRKARHGASRLSARIAAD